MTRYTTTPGTAGRVHIIDTATGDRIFTGGCPREAARLLTTLNRVARDRHLHVPEVVLHGLVSLLRFNKGAHPDILAARALEAATPADATAA